MCWKGTVCRPSTSAPPTPPVNAVIQAIAHCGTTTRPSPPTPRPAITDAAMTCVPGSRDGKTNSGILRKVNARTAISPTRSQAGTRCPERPTQVIACVRASCIAPRLTAATAPTQGNSQPAGTRFHKLATMIRAATILATAKNGASCARDISCTSRNGELPGSASLAARPADSPPGRRAETNLLYRSGASYIHRPFDVWEGTYPKRVEAELRAGA